MKLHDNGIATLNDWFRFSPPMGGEKQWKDGRSAKELARYITSALPNVPAEIEKKLSHFVSSDSAFECLHGKQASKADFGTDSSYGMEQLDLLWYFRYRSGGKGKR